MIGTRSGPRFPYSRLTNRTRKIVSQAYAASLTTWLSVPIQCGLFERVGYHRHALGDLSQC